MLRKTILIATLCPGEKHVSQGFVRSISSCEPLSWMTNSPLSIIRGPMPVSLKLTFRIAVKACISTQPLSIYSNMRHTYLHRSHKLKMKWARFPKCIGEENRLPALHLRRDSSDEILDLAYVLEQLDVGASIDSAWRHCMTFFVERTEFESLTQPVVSLVPYSLREKSVTRLYVIPDT
jgi:hypothetical protein